MFSVTLTIFFICSLKIFLTSLLMKKYSVILKFSYKSLILLSILFILETLICSSNTLQFVFIYLSRVTAPTVDTRSFHRMLKCTVISIIVLHFNELLHRWRLNVWGEWTRVCQKRIARVDRNKNVVSARWKPAHFLWIGLEGCIPYPLEQTSVLFIFGEQ